MFNEQISRPYRSTGSTHLELPVIKWRATSTVAVLKIFPKIAFTDAFFRAQNVPNPFSARVRGSLWRSPDPLVGSPLPIPFPLNIFGVSISVPSALRSVSQFSIVDLWSPNSSGVIQQVTVTHLQCAAKKVSPKVFCHFLSNRSEFLHEISHTYYSFIIT